MTMPLSPERPLISDLTQLICGEAKIPQKAVNNLHHRAVSRIRPSAQLTQLSQQPGDCKMFSKCKQRKMLLEFKIYCPILLGILVVGEPKQQNLISAKKFVKRTG